MNRFCNSISYFFKNFFLPVLLFFLVTQSKVTAQDANSILQKCNAAGAKINNGKYRATYRVKYLSRNDTIVVSGNCRFHRFPADTLKNAKFEITTDNTRIFYDARKKTTLYTGDSIAIVHDKWKYPMQLTGTIYHLLSGYMVNNTADLDDAVTNTALKKTVLKDTLIGTVTCYHVSIKPLDDETSKNISRQLFISKSNYFLMGEITDLESNQHHQFTELFLQNVETNAAGLSDKYGDDLIPDGYFIKQYLPSRLNKLLPGGIVAPGFTLLSLDNKKTTLEDFKSKTTVLFFWNGLDRQCRLALPVLQKLSDTYAASGVEMVGMNVSAQEAESLKKFLNKQKITFTQLTGAVNVAEKFNIVSVPTMYVIGKDGKVIGSFSPSPQDNIQQLTESLILKSK